MSLPLMHLCQSGCFIILLLLFVWLFVCLFNVLVIHPWLCLCQIWCQTLRAAQVRPVWPSGTSSYLHAFYLPVPLISPHISISSRCSSLSHPFYALLTSNAGTRLILMWTRLQWGAADLFPKLWRSLWSPSVHPTTIPTTTPKRSISIEKIESITKGKLSTLYFFHSSEMCLQRPSLCIFNVRSIDLNRDKFQQNPMGCCSTPLRCLFFTYWTCLIRHGNYSLIAHQD